MTAPAPAPLDRAALGRLRVALVHDWLITYRGGERVLEAIAELVPHAHLFTLVHQPGALPAALEAHPIHTSLLQRIPGVAKRYRHFLPLMPAAIEALDLRGYDLVLSSSHCVAKGVRVPEGVPHLAYVHAPMRYMWDLFDDYFGPGRASAPVRAAALAMRPMLRRWDVRSSRRVSRFVANSDNIARKVKRFWDRDASVVHPPVELERFAQGPLTGTGQGGYFLWLGALAPYKRVDLAIEAFRRLATRTPAPQLWIAGSGQDEGRLEQLPPNVRVLGQVPADGLAALYRNARALLFTGEEDFGITPLESQATGRPVIALARGGVLETVTAETGLFFQQQTVDALVEALERFDAFEPRFDPAAARANALRFSRARFQAEYLAQLAALLAQPGSARP